MVVDFGGVAGIAAYAMSPLTPRPTLQSQVAEAEAAQVITSIINLIDDESEEEVFDSDIDELAW